MESEKTVTVAQLVEIGCFLCLGYITTDYILGQNLVLTLGYVMGVISTITLIFFSGR